MRPRTLILLALVAATLLIVFLLGRDDAQRTGSSGRARLLRSFVPQRVQELHLLPADGSQLVLKRLPRPGRWQISMPFAAPADPAAVKKILAALEFLQASRRVAVGVDLKQLGLEPPRARLRVHMRGRSSPLELNLGAMDVSGTGLYLRYEGEVVVVSSELQRRVDIGVDQWRERELVPFSAAEIDEIEVAVDTERPIRLEQRARRWVVRAGPGWVRAAPGPVAQLLGALSGLYARHLAAGPVAVDPSSGRSIRLSADGVTFVVRVGSACAGHHGERAVWRQLPDEPPLRGCIDEEDAARLWPAKTRLYDTALTHLGASALERLSLSKRGDQEGVAVWREGVRWRVSAQGSSATEGRDAGPLLADGDLVADWVARLRAVRATVEPVATAAELTQYGLGRAGLIVLHPEEGAEERLSFGQPTARGVPIRRGEELALSWAPPQVLALLEVSPHDLRSRRILALEPHEIARVRVVRASGHAEELVERAGDGWRVREPVEVRADPALMATLVGRLSALRVRRFVDAAELARERGEGVVLQIGLVVDDVSPGGKTLQSEVRLDLAYQPDGRCLGKRLGKGGVGASSFELEPEDCRLIVERKAIRRLFDFNPAALRAVALSWPKGNVRFARGDGGWFDGDKRVDAARVSRMVAWIRKLEAARVQAYRAPANPGDRRVAVELVGDVGQTCSFEANGSAWCAGRPVLYELPRGLVSSISPPNVREARLGE
jgi:hypothetical protein